MKEETPVKRVWESKSQKKTRRGGPRKTWDGVIAELFARKGWESKSQKKTRRGGPRKTWDGVIAELFARKGTTWTQAKRLAKDRREWRRYTQPERLKD
ncbi:hypothetical protein QE152_g4767 [Popillia japonica]|uniref:Uncharacterized protein n=1 Tax=Popillia japonica TaxID=7064 RepID=A0AAW1MY48_POPJA